MEVDTAFVLRVLKLGLVKTQFLPVLPLVAAALSDSELRREQAP